MPQKLDHYSPRSHAVAFIVGAKVYWLWQIANENFKIRLLLILAILKTIIFIYYALIKF